MLANLFVRCLILFYDTSVCSFDSQTAWLFSSCLLAPFTIGFRTRSYCFFRPSTSVVVQQRANNPWSSVACNEFKFSVARLNARF